MEQSASIILDHAQILAVRVDRRTARTRRLLLAAFIELVLERNYASVGIADIVERADIGRSTFYRHFRSKDELLLSSMSWMFAILADASTPASPRQPVRDLAEHFWSNRRLAQIVLSPPIERRLRRALTAALLDRLTANNANTDVEIYKLASERIAAGQLGVLEAWTKGEFAVSVDAIADEIIAIARK